MALLVRVLRNQTSISQWVPVCSQLVSVSPTQRQWSKTLSSTSQWLHKNRAGMCGGSEQSAGMDTPQRRKYHNTSKLPNTQDPPQPVEEKVGPFTKMIEAMGFTGPLKYSKWKIKIAALRMYTSCVEKTDFEEFFLRCQMPDTFNSWFLITLLHVWMCLVRMKQEGRTGKYMCRIIVHFMWEDVEQRGRVMGVNSYILKKNMALMTNNFYAAILGYDEGILSDDHGLAAALWRTFFNQKCEDPRQLELLVEYVRKQMQYLDSMNGEDLLLTGEVRWRPLVEKNPQSILKPHAPTYNDEGL
ncbi:ubiquinol-cytochrome-c reductase complex assembly factor 1 isoform X1 [Mastomys coucha]|uniref:ubiquinol-cytochrome-c reductase complex assembly factor 1 isoform X1 n=1 Tax=Mastomys coucha TaxID=35658 RepID=UPI001261FF18|nr:ubiquinol-cytochrome-c reductase complex assembly factor 1 isoform X1 [Mastomys coucha]XP_031228299.1 ubiquinol-cytochrome-c reductase complex assembly factor 1 isoform X1 [Mastomys coucha]